MYVLCILLIGINCLPFLAKLLRIRPNKPFAVRTKNIQKYCYVRLYQIEINLSHFLKQCSHHKDNHKDITCCAKMKTLCTSTYIHIHVLYIDDKKSTNCG